MTTKPTEPSCPIGCFAICDRHELQPARDQPAPPNAASSSIGDWPRYVARLNLSGFGGHAGQAMYVSIV